MFNYDEIPDLSILKNGEIDYFQFNRFVNQIQKSKNIFVFYEYPNGQYNLMLEGESHVLYSCMLAKLSQNNQTHVFEFLKLLLEGIIKIKKLDITGHESAVRIVNHFKCKK